MIARWRRRSTSLLLLLSDICSFTPDIDVACIKLCDNKEYIWQNRFIIGLYFSDGIIKFVLPKFNNQLMKQRVQKVACMCV